MVLSLRAATNNTIPYTLDITRIILIYHSLWVFQSSQLPREKLFYIMKPQKTGTRPEDMTGVVEFEYPNQDHWFSIGPKHQCLVVERVYRPQKCLWECRKTHKVPRSWMRLAI